MHRRKLPALDQDTEAFWTSGASGKLEIHYCRHCRRYQHPPLSVCPQCGEDTQPTPVSGRGKVASYSVNHQAWAPGQEVPFVLAMVELDEQPGLVLVTNIVECDPGAVYVDMPVGVHFVRQEDVWLPLFRPREPA